MLALRAPALYKDIDWEAPKRKLHVDPDFAAYRRLALRAEENRALGACAQFLGDALVVESEHDEIIPHPAVTNYIARSPMPFAHLPRDRRRRPRARKRHGGRLY